ncbi:MAG TPA: hypothetical protein PLV70_07720 [Flavobacteriales bacterium]|jgi:hypothetical protein|nr:hypothetical protein [Flavobacteriales bacterium]HRN37863.1 hypothetical protein [Flavobacteriales bacterium]HRO40491.1 hypothetical protein [Flavobacteriales bacterium]HRP81700.1 hypothetical protein [Flavobacteriales bacterium]HRQ84980.1 hypothetical protein [Flavobacteriales bacterium]
MTLTLLLQLTDEEQLFAQQVQPAVVPQKQEIPAPATVTAEQETCAEWPDAPSTGC